MRYPLIFSLVLVVSALGAAPAAAQDDGPTVELDTNATAETTQYTQEIDSALRLMEWKYDDDRDGFRLVFESDTSKRLTLTEAVQFERGAGTGRIYSKRLPPGQTAVFVPVEKRGGQAALTLTTPLSVDQNRFSYVSTGQTPPDRPPIPYGQVRLLVGLTAVGAAGMTFRIVRKRQESEDKEVKRVL